MDKNSCRVGGIVLAAGIGLALTTGYGTAGAEAPASESTGAEAPSDPGASPSAGSRPSKSAGEAPSSSTVDEESADPDLTAADEDIQDDEDLTEDIEADEHDADRGDDRGTRKSDETDTAPAAEETATSADTDEPTHSDASHETPESDADGTTPLPAVERNKAAAPSAVATEIVPATTKTAAPVVVTKPVSFFSKLLTAFGVTREPRPAESPLMAVILAWLRRQLDGATVRPPTPPQTSTSSVQSGATVNVRNYGAIGDGVTDDSAAIKAAEAALVSGDRLYFPEGDYRFAEQNPTGNAAVLLKGLSNVTVEFDEGARLLMDNLASNGHGTSHGIRVEGAASHVTLLNPTIEWVTRPSARSFGDGISVLGWPSDSAPPSGWTGSTGLVEFVSIVNARVVNSPQAGVVVMGASDVTVTDMTAIGTLADGLHFNANRRVTVDGLVAENTGDDGLAFVTYYHASQPWTYGPTDGPFNQSGLGEWNNSDSTATNISVTGGRANGFRVQGGYDITISDVTVTDKEFGFHVNSAIATGPGDWTSIASQDISISDVTITGAQTGIVLATNNIDGTEDPMWWEFSGVEISDVTILDSQNWSLAVETPATVTSKFAGVTLRNIYAGTDDAPTGGGNGGILLASLHDSVIDNVRLVSEHSADINLLGAGQLRGGVSVGDLPSSNLSVNDLILEGPGRILIQDIAGVEFGDVSSTGADGAAVVLYRVKDASFDNITATLPGRGSGEGYGVRLLLVNDIDIENIEVTMDDHVGSTWWAVEFGGGNPAEGIAGDGVRIENVTYTSDRNDTDSDVAIQGGTYGPVDWYINATWRHSGETVPQWRSATYGDISPL